MGHKVNPTGFRIGVIRGWQAKWYAEKHYADYLQEDLKLRKAIQAKYADAAVSAVEIEREANQVSVIIHTARPGIVIGRGGQRVDEMRRYLEGVIEKKVQLNIQEIQRPELDAYLVARNVAEQIERRVAYRRAMKQAMLRTMQSGAKGMKVSCAGRLGGAEIARRLNMHEGQVPLHTLRADIDYGFIEAHTVMGRIGIKVWIYKGQVLPEPKAEGAEEAPSEVVVQAGTEAIPEEKSTKPRVRRARAKPSPEPEVEEAAPAEAVAEEMPSEAPEEKPAKPVRKRRVAPAQAEAEVEPVEAEEEKPAKTVRRKTKATPAPAEAEVEPVEAEEEKPAKTVRRRTKAAPKAESEEGETDVTA